MGRLDSGKQKLMIKKTTLTEPITEAIMVLETVDKFNHPIHFNNHTEKSTIETDSGLLSHILNNLLSNAAKYSPQASEIIVELSDGGNFYNISVADSGIGIPPEDIGNLFDPFFRANNSTTISGTGLGLAIVKRYVTKLNGTIEIESKINVGTKITVKLPKIYEDAE
jgi:signal transduction histidine kinase